MVFDEEYRFINYFGLNEIVMMHDDFRIKKMFIPMIEELIKKRIKFEMPVR